MKDLKGFRLHNPTAISHKEFGSERKTIYLPKQFQSSKKESKYLKLDKVRKPRLLTAQGPGTTRGKGLRNILSASTKDVRAFSPS